MGSLNRTLVAAFGTGLALVGLWVLFSSGVALPTRSPPRQFHFSGMSLLLLGVPPLLLGCTCVAIACRWLGGQSRLARAAIGTGIVMLGLAFILATQASPRRPWPRGRCAAHDHRSIPTAHHPDTREP